jgi:hypothetical protein
MRSPVRCRHLRPAAYDSRSFAASEHNEKVHAARSAGILLLAATTIGAAACGGSSQSLPRPDEAFCVAAERYDRRVERRAPLREQIELVSRMADHAPNDIARDARVFLAWLERRRAGEARASTRVEEAVNNVNRRAQQGCGYLEDEGNVGI